MKRVLSILFLTLMIVTLAGCKSTSQTDGSTDGIDTPNVAEPGDGLGRIIIDSLTQGVFYLSYTLEFQYPTHDIEYELEVQVYRDATKSVRKAVGDVPNWGYQESRVMIKDGLWYYIDDGARTYSDSTVLPEFDAAGFYSPIFTGMVLTGSGTAEFKGLSRPYEDYQTIEGELIRFYFGPQKNLIALVRKAYTLDETFRGNIEGTATFVFKSLSSVEPKELFDIPADYKDLSEEEESI